MGGLLAMGGSIADGGTAAAQPILRMEALEGGMLALLGQHEA